MKRPRQATFVPRCPACEYDLSGTPGERCPECGALFSRAKVWNPPAPPPDDWPQNFLLVGATLTAMIGLGSRITPARWAQFGLAWGLALGWVYFRRRSVLGRKPWLVLWLVPVAMGTSDLLDDAIGADVTPYYVLGVAAAAIIFGLVRSPRSAGAAMLYAVAALLMYIGGGFAIMAALSQFGLFDGGEWDMMGLRGPSGGPIDFVAGGVGVLLAVAGVGLWRLAGRLRAGAST